MSAPTLPIAVATEPSEPGRSGRVTRIRNTCSSFPTSITAVFRVDKQAGVCATSEPCSDTASNSVELLAPLAADRALESAYFVVTRRRKACPLAPPQHGGARSWNPYGVPRFEPFAAIRYVTDDLASVIAPPYDVLSDADVDALEARSIHNIVHIDVPRGGGPLRHCRQDDACLAR